GATTQPLLEPHTTTVLEEETPALPTPLSPDNVEVVWKRTLDSLSGLLMDHAAEADEVAVDEQGRLVLRFAESFHRDFCERANNRTRLEKALEQACGKQVRLVMQTRNRVDAVEPPPSKPKSRRQQLADVAAQPFVQKAMELFDGDPSRLRYVPPEEQ
ncbi:MAG: hypothetical protein MI725_02055, partial [Pirellulales bacterium]|nr:hypothetical protein [Pirellulales bacterium]